MRLALSLAAVSAGLFALGAVAVILGGLCCPPAGYVLIPAIILFLGIVAYAAY